MDSGCIALIINKSSKNVHQICGAKTKLIVNGMNLCNRHKNYIDIELHKKFLQNQQFILQYDNFRIIKNSFDTIHLIINRDYLTPKLITCNAGKRPKDKEKYMVTYFDFSSLNKTSKSFPGHNSVSYNNALDLLNSLPKYNKDNIKQYVIEFSIIDIFLNLSKFKWLYRIYKMPKHYDEIEVPIPGYILGIWLGDGYEGQAALTNIDNDVIKTFTDYVKNLGLYTRKNEITYYATGKNEKRNVFLDKLKSQNLIRNKHIPDIYKYNSEYVRFEVLAGLIDTDGYLNSTYYDFTQSIKNMRIFDDIKEIAESLGFKMTKNKCTKTCTYKGKKKKCDAIRGSIIGDIFKIPVRVQYKRCIKEKHQTYDYHKFDISIL